MSYKYEKQICLGRDASGNRIRIWAKANTRTELEKKIQQLKEEYEKAPGLKKITFKEYSEKWLETFKAKRALNTYNMYMFTMKKFTDLNPLPVRSITKTDVQKVINDNWEMRKTCENIRLTLNQIFNAAIEDEMIYRNPVRGVELPKRPPKATQIQAITGRARKLTDLERNAVKSAELKPMDRLYVNLLYYLGLRPGEALALTIGDFKNNCVTISKSLAYDVNTPFIKKTKTEVVRTIPAPEPIVKQVKDYQKTNKKLYLFHTEKGELMTKSGQVRMWQRIAKAINSELGGDNNINVLNGMTAYTLRHDFASRLRELEGISPVMQAYIMGHSEQVLTANYSHITTNDIIDNQTIRKHMAM